MLLAEVLAEIDRRGLNSDGEKVMVEGPKTDDELWEAVYELTGFKIPRAAVCTEHDHVAPFTIFADLYFERTTDVLCIGNRGGGKTTISGFLHGAKCRYNPGYKTAISGAVEKQGHRAYAEFKRFIRNLSEEVVDTMLSKTTWQNGAELEVLGGTVKQLNGPHPHLAQMDEVELTTSDSFEEFQNMAQGDQRYDGQQLLTSTRKRSFGMVQKIVGDCEEAKKQGAEPPWDVRIFCVFETMANVPNCQNGCGCDKVIKGTWDDGTPRTFESVCGGRAKRADGFVKLDDVRKRFRQLNRLTWEAQQECLRPNIDGVVHKWVSDQHMLDHWYPDPDFGPVFRSWDWGGTNPHSVHFSQLLTTPVEVDGRIFEEGCLITFDEIYQNNIGFGELALKVFARTEEWHQSGYDFEIEYDFCDPAGAAAKLDVKRTAEEAGYPPPKFRSIPCPRYESVQKHIEWGEDNRLFFVSKMCPNLADEYSAYHWPDEKPGQNRKEEPVKEDDHAMDDQRYLIWNLWRLGLMKSTGDAPASSFEGRANDPSKKRKDMSPTGSTMSPSYLMNDPRTTTIRSQDAPSVRRA